LFLPLRSPATRSFAQAAAIRDEVAKAFIGQDAVLDQVIVALLAGGHVLLEGVPGLGKTLLVRALAQALGCSFARVQFTPDLMPSDISGHAVYDPKTERFQLRRGPCSPTCCSPTKSTARRRRRSPALLEAMQEQRSRSTARASARAAVLSLATQNPLELEGTYPLPEAQLDRFLLKLLIGYPSSPTKSAWSPR
jgi:MoxR-like ATPase